MTSKTCCYFVDIRTGCIVIGVFALVNSVIHFITNFTDVKSNWLGVLESSLFTIAAVFLLLGIYQSHVKYFNLYLILQGITIVLSVCYVVVLCGNLNASSSPEDVTKVSISSIVLVIYIYFYCVVYQYYKLLNTELPR